MGLIASGKSTLARAWADTFSLPYYNSDAVRKELAGFSASSRQGESFHQGIYTPEMTRKTYDALLDHAKQELTAGRSVVLDASYSTRSERDLAWQCTTECGSRLFFILCQCDEDETRRRLEKRSQDPMAVSDATWEIYQKQLQHFEYPDEVPSHDFMVINTKAFVKDLIDSLQEKINKS
jgi:hypothetical protein